MFDLICQSNLPRDSVSTNFAGLRLWQGLEWRGRTQRYKEGLADAFDVPKKEQPVFDDWSPQAASHLISLERRVLASREVGHPCTLIAKEVQTLSVNPVRARPGENVYRSGRCQFRRKIQSRLAELEFLNRTSRDVLRSSAHGFIADVDAIQSDSGGTAVAPAERDRRKPVLGGIEVAAILDLHTGLELVQVQEIASIE